MAVTLTLAGRRRAIAEPPLGRLRIILASYNALASADGSPAAQVDALNRLLDAVTAGAIRDFRRLKPSELPALLDSIPPLCRFSTNENGKPTDWGMIYAHLSASFGWTYAYINDHVTLGQLDEYQGYMRQNPPTHVLVAAYLGYEYQDKTSGSAFLKMIAAQAQARKQS